MSCCARSLDRLFRAVLVLGAVGILANPRAASALPPLASPVSADVQSALQRLEQAAGGPVPATLSPDTGLVTFLAADPRHPVTVDAAPGASPEEIARTFLGAYGAAFGFRGAPAVELERPAERDELGMDHVRFRQTVKGVPVTAGELIVHLRGSSVVAVNAETLAGLEGFDVRPTFAAEPAAALARNYAALRLGQSDAEISEPRLEILNKGLLEDGSQPSRLAWFVEARGLALREYLWIDARSGRFLLRFSQLTDARNRQIYTGNSTAALPGTLIRSEGQPDTGDTDGNAAYRYSGDTYDYYFNQHGRDSFDGTGGTLISTVHHCPSPGNCPFANAFWNGTQMVYGEGYAAADDVDAHELTHAVTERTSGLYYYMQSGALDESFSDIFGETVDLTNTGGNDAPGVRWLLGEDVPGGAIRNMMSPGAFGDPAKVTDANYFCGGSDVDNGGVHFNSGVPNHFYALLADGGTFNSQTVTGIGLTKAGKVAYRALTAYFLSGTGFPDAASALDQSCADLVGTAGITVADCQQVTKSLLAVEMTATPPCSAAAAAAPALCPAGQTPANLFFDNAETGLANTNWALDPAWLLDNLGYTTSGIWHFVGFDLDTTDDSSLQMTGSVAIPANARMQFNHSWDFEPPAYDGGVVEYSTTGGPPWLDAGSLTSAGPGYTGTVNNCCGNPLASRPAYVGASRRYSATQLDLATLSGQNVRFRFRMGADSLFGWWGWDVDDVRIYQCASCSYSVPANKVYVGEAGGSGTVDLSTQTTCTWTASTGTPWLTLTPGGTGSGKAGFTAAANTTGSPRSGTFTAGGQTVTVYQGSAADYFTVTPCRILSGVAMTSGVPQTFMIAGTCGIPSTAQAVSANLTAVNPTAQGNLTVYPGGLSKPLATSINFPPTLNRSNNAILLLAPDGAGTVNADAFVAGGGTMNLYLDVTGYFE